MVYKKEGYIQREIESVLKDLVKHFPAVALTGPRQSGKSTLLSAIFSETHTLVSFDDPLMRERAMSDPGLFIESLGKRIIFDEIQYVPQIISYIKMLIDKDRDIRGRFIITGSQQFNLIKDLSDSLAGRIALLDLLPFSIIEQRKVPLLKSRLSDPLECFVHSCLRGSFPEVNTHYEMDIRNWYGSYIQTYLERDIRTIYNIGSLREFHQFLRLLASRCSQILSLSSFANDLGISVNTVKKWISILEASRIIYILPPFYRNLGKRVRKSPKIYFLDSGLVCYLTGIKERDYLLNGTMVGPLFENFVIQETVKHFFNRGRRPNLFYLRSHNDLEVDLIIEESLKLYPFEIKFTKTPQLKMARQIERFKSLFSELQIEKGNLITISDHHSPLTKDVSVINMDTYVQKFVDFG